MKRKTPFTHHAIERVCEAVCNRLGVFALQIGEQPAHKHEHVFARFTSRQQRPKRSEKFFQPLVRPGKSNFRNFRILFNFTFSCRKSRVHDNPLVTKYESLLQHGENTQDQFHVFMLDSTVSQHQLSGLTSQ